jgi:alanine racemase
MANTPLKPGKLTVDLGALKNNYRLFRSMTSARVAAAVKADGYGVGMIPVARALIEEGCDTFFVATADEGATLRAQNDKIQIAVLGGLMHGVEEDYLQHTIHPVLNSLEMISRWQALSKKKGHKLQAIIHFDTGMNRLGLGEDETKTLLASPALLDGLDVKIIMSHFACSDEKDHPLNDLQAQRFAAIAKAFPKAVKSLSNSSGLFRNADWHHDMVRTGYALYGGNPTPETHNPVQSVVKSATLKKARLSVTPPAIRSMPTPRPRRSPLATPTVLRGPIAIKRRSSSGTAQPARLSAGFLWISSPSTSHHWAATCLSPAISWKLLVPTKVLTRWRPLPPLVMKS